MAPTALTIVGIIAGILLLALVTSILVFTIYTLRQTRKHSEKGPSRDNVAPTAPPPPSTYPLQDNAAAVEQGDGSNPPHLVEFESQTSHFFAKLFADVASDIQRFPGELPPIMFVECMRNILIRVPLDMKKEYPEFDGFVEGMISKAEELSKALRKNQVHATGQHVAIDSEDELTVELDKLQGVLDNKYEQYSKRSEDSNVVMEYQGLEESVKL